jgi:hypothetical protein
VRQDVGVIRISSLAAALAVVATLSACSAPHAGPDGAGGPGGGQPGTDAQTVDPWISDDLEFDAVVATSEFGGLPLTGFTCDISESIGVESAGIDPPYASVIVSSTGSSIEHHDGAGLNLAFGPTTPPSAFVETIAVDAPDGTFHLSTEGSNDPWSANAVLTLTQVPVPPGTYGCWAAAIWFEQMSEVGTEASQIVREFTEQGVRNVEDECADFGYDWAPPNLTCEEFGEAIDSFG